MKKILMMFLALALGLGGAARAETNAAGKVISLANQYKGYEEFEVVRVGPLVMKFIKMASGKAIEDEQEGVLALMDGIRKMVIVDYDGVEDRVREEFDQKVRKVLSRCEVLMEAKDGDELVRVFGKISADGDSVSDVVIYVPSDGALICITGTVDLDSVKDMTGKSSNILSLTR
ncbi:MAG: DUF4252 domain-containing protein [Bacteroidales bacterium]|nr:DUF4252 domain-containing protein [Bacteroidales bacterium]